MKVDESFTDRHGRSCLVFSGVKKFSDVYDWLFDHYNGYKFGIVLDCSVSEHPRNGESDIRSLHGRAPRGSGSGGRIHPQG